MPLENDIQGLTAAINRLADVFAGTAAQVAGGAPAKAEPKAEAETKPAKAEPKKAAPAAKAEVKATKAKPEPKADDLDADAGEVIDFEEVKTVLRELGAKMAEVKGATEGRQVVIDLLGEFKVAKAIELKTAQYAAFIKRATELMNGEGTTEEEDDLVG